MATNPSYEVLGGGNAAVVPVDTNSAPQPVQPTIQGTGQPAFYSDAVLSPQSCQFCRRRKIKCDKSLPVCNQCSKARQTCVYAPSQRRGRPRGTGTAGASAEQSKEVLVKRIKKLEALLQAYKLDPGRSATPSDDISDPLGKLVIGKPYLDDGFWSSKELTDVLGDSEESESDEDYVNPPSSDATDFLWGVTPIVQDLSRFHPPRSQIIQYWQIYLENCECLLRIIHTPTTEKVVKRFVDSDLQDINQNDELLLFCFYFAAITSLSDEEALQQFGRPRGILLGQHELAIKHALTRSHFLYTQDFKVLQALTLYLICLRHGDATVSTVTWNMTGLAFRIAQGMAIDRDGELFKLPPFETEMRRRLWYQLLFIDLRAAETRGSLSAFLRYDTRLPTSIDESELDPDMTEYPKNRPGYTDMTIPLMRYEVARLGRRLQATGFRDTPLPHEAKKKVIEDFQQRLFTKYDQHCIGNGPLPEYCSKTANMITQRTNLVVYQGKMKEASQEEKDWLFLICIEIMEYYEELSRNTVARKWSWLLKIHTQWHAIAFALSELCERKPSPQTERAWKVIDATSSDWQPPPDATGTVIYNSVKKLLSKAHRRRDFFARSSVETSSSPNFSDSTSSHQGSKPSASSSEAAGYHPFDSDRRQQPWQSISPETIGSHQSYAVNEDSIDPTSLTTTAPFLQNTITAIPPLDPMQDTTNLPDWFFGVQSMQDQNTMGFAVDDMAWDWDQNLQNFMSSNPGNDGAMDFGMEASRPALWNMQQMNTGSGFQGGKWQPNDARGGM